MTTGDVLGEGFGGIVIEDGPDAVRKFYVREQSGRAEQTHLDFLRELQEDGFGIGCAIPGLLGAIGKGRWEINDETYVYCNRMERIPGTNARLAAPSFSRQSNERLGDGLGAAAFAMHDLSQEYVKAWKRQHGDEDALLTHITGYKVNIIKNGGADKETVERVTDAADYLEAICRPLADMALSHLDFSLSNTQAGTDGRLHGLVDWGDFGLTNPSLSLYQMAYRQVWPYLQRRYEELGGTIRKDIVYAAAVINLAYAPISYRQHGYPQDPEETPESFDATYARFEQHRHI